MSPVLPPAADPDQWAHLARLARHWARQTELGRGIRLEAPDLDLLNLIGLGEMLAAEAARQQRERSTARLSQRRSPDHPDC